MKSFSIALFFLISLLSCQLSLAQEGSGTSSADLDSTAQDNLIPSRLLESVLAFSFEGIDQALENGESIDVVNDHGWSAAMFAVANGDLDMLRALIDRRIDLNIADSEGVTPLMLAASAADREAVELLVAANASPLATANDGSTAHSKAVASGRQLISLLIAEAVAQHGLDSENIEAVLQAIRDGAYPNIRNAAGWTPLIQATAFNQVDAVREVLRYGADPNRTENDGWTALHFAASIGNAEIVQTLLAANADATMRNGQDKTPRELAQEGGHLEIVDLLPAADEL